ncbi:hypothetical protein [Pseudonocardia humida]|uniref:Uncharacterized protein n=1 Tax=Pseudonocardia humida TaxID=2800819 RepID=A0ABT1A3T0_9PSEU|nr:hypothetical protein [Pseudonocardia humida]MCO1657652.1 hypothetical protein [Pseudonocardia humida]
MVDSEEARARLAEIAERRKQVLDGTTRGRHRGWDTTGLVALVAGFAAMDLPVPMALRLSLFGGAVIAALACFTHAGRHGRVAMHRSQMTPRFWALLAGGALASAALTVAGLRLLDQIDFPLRNTLVGVVLAVFIAATHPLYRALLLRTAR